MKKFGAILLVVVMLLSMLPINAFAQTSEGEVITSGSCGDNLSWTLDENGLLVISGTGDMANWNFWDVSAPWLNYSEQISKVIIEEGVTSIGQNAFCSEDSYFDYNDHFYSALTEIDIPNTVTTIHTNGISGLDVLETITLPPSVTTMVGAM
ncbi:MAG: leucine-rich repeat protein [Clostridia bacterium]|nr:leucine-rich repeat protein [Clostridia bacterium]